GTSAPVNFVLITSVNPLPDPSLLTPHITTQHFQIVHEQVRYICDPTTGYLTRYWWPANAIVTPSATIPIGASSALLASNVSTCSFSVSSAGLVTLSMTITEGTDSISLS